MALPVLQPDDYRFPDPRNAARDPNGLLAIGGDLAPKRLLQAYSQGIFPWFNSDDDPILWWSPDPRAVIEPRAFRPSRSLRKRLRSGQFSCRMDTQFAAVIDGCASAARRDGAGTWITPNMQNAYRTLHEAGYAHSIEVLRDERLVGGLYGLSLGTMFFGESMFSATNDASKVAFAYLCRQLIGWNFDLIDCQMMNPHLASLGVAELSRDQFLTRLDSNAAAATRQGRWVLEAQPW